MSRPAAEILVDLTAARAARLNALQATKYTLNSGQGSQSVERDLKEINATIRDLEAEYAEATGENPGVIFATGDRGAI